MKFSVKKFIGMTLPLVGSVLFSSAALAQYKPYIDQNYAIEQERIKKQIKASCPAGKPIKYVECAKSAREEWNKIHPKRGTPEYAELHYSKLSEAEAKAKVKELYALSDNARPFAVKAEPGEVVREDFEAEAMWIRVSILHEKLLDPSRVKARQ